MVDLEIISKVPVDLDEKCLICVQSKQPGNPFKSIIRNSSLLELIHSDGCYLNGVSSKGGNKYFITFIDDMSKFFYVYLMKIKDESFSKFVIYKTEVENQLERKIKIIRSDRGGEYSSNQLV